MSAPAEPSTVVVVLSTAPAEAAAGKRSATDLAKALLHERLCACVNVVPGVRSFFRWEGKVEGAEEVPLLIKTSTARYAALASATLQSIGLLELLPLPGPWPDPERTSWHRPSTAENPLGAWHVRGELRTRSEGALAGRTVALKDNVLLAGAPLANGSTILGDYRPREDATIITRMLAAGATIVGKTVCEAYCFSAGSHTSASGVVRNPHDPERSAGDDSARDSGNESSDASGQSSHCARSAHRGRVHALSRSGGGLLFRASAILGWRGAESQ